jgi:hypothetical protein
MTVDYLIHILENKILSLNQHKIAAENCGDIDTIIKIDQEIKDTENTIAKLKI